MRGLRLWSVLSGEVLCPPYPIALRFLLRRHHQSLLLMLLSLTRMLPKADDDVVAAYDRQVQEYFAALATYRLDLTAYTHWMDDDARAAAVLTSSVLPQFASEFMGLGTIAAMWVHLRQRHR